MTINDPGLTERMLPTLKRVAGDNNVSLRERLMGAEDFSFFTRRRLACSSSWAGRPRART